VFGLKIECQQWPRLGCYPAIPALCWPTDSFRDFVPRLLALCHFNGRRCCCFCCFALASAAFAAAAFAANDQWRFQLVAAAAVHTLPLPRNTPPPSFTGDRHPTPNGTACEIAAAMRIAGTEQNLYSIEIFNFKN